MPKVQRPISASARSRPGKRRPVAPAVSREPNLSHIAPGLRSLAVRVAELSLMVGNPRAHPVKNLEAIQAALLEYGQVETVS